ncbi:GntR family transcriptional regulator [Marinitenerispora sediminis]|uniref:GntR family transcriptional regulator n=1 Tax=Marinitenerispora sediminis TaxID=1931232 RepID=UPI00268D82D4
MTVAQDGVERLAGDRAELERPPSTAELVAEALRGQIIDGALAPGTRLSEKELFTRLGVSRNTLREAFLLLVHERLLVRRPHHGVSVAKPTVADVIDLYRVRRALELSAVRAAAQAPPGALDAVGAAVREGERAAAAADWKALGTANMRFHAAIAGLTGSQRVAEVMRQLLAEMRLVFHVMAAPREFHEPYLAMNREIHLLLRDGAAERAAERLADYLDVAERQLVDAFAAREADTR